MNNVQSYLDERKDEFERHISIARMLEARVDESNDEGDVHIEVRHINTLKSGLLIHLYNIVEAIMTKTLATVGEKIITEKPRCWTEAVLKEWVRAEVWNAEERIGDGALRRLAQVSGILASGNSPEVFAIKGEPGSWDDKSIKKVSERLGCELTLSSSIRRAAYEKIYRNETTALEYLAGRRNAIAHGASTFEYGAHDLTLDELANLSRRVLPYLEAVLESYQDFLVNKRFLNEDEVAA